MLLRLKRPELGLVRPVNEVHAAGLCPFPVNRERVAAGETPGAEIVVAEPDCSDQRLDRDVVERGSGDAGTRRGSAQFRSPT